MMRCAPNSRPKKQQKTIEIAELPDACLHAPSRGMPGWSSCTRAPRRSQEVNDASMASTASVAVKRCRSSVRTSSRTWTPLVVNEVVSAIAASAAGAGICRRLHPPSNRFQPKMDSHGTSTRSAVPEMDHAKGGQPHYYGSPGALNIPQAE
jgi:hypothetical protein